MRLCTIRFLLSCFTALVILSATEVAAKPTVQKLANKLVVTGENYRATFSPENPNPLLEVRGADEQWHPVSARNSITFALYRGEEVYTLLGVRSTWHVEHLRDVVIIGAQAVLESDSVLDLHYICTNLGILVGARLAQRVKDDGQGRFWAPPRFGLKPADWDGYLFWGADDRPREGRIADLAPLPAYAGVSAWEQQGDVVHRLSSRHPAIIVKSRSWEMDFGVVFVDYSERWSRSHMFLQRHTPESLWFYTGYTPAGDAEKTLWAWLAPFPRGSAVENAQRVEQLVAEGARIVQGFRPVSPPVPEDWTRPLPDFPKALRRSQPVKDINEALVFTVNEFTASDYSVDLAKKVGADVLIRGWFKWAQAPPVHEYRRIPVMVRQMGALFGGGITCSALYDGENGITREQLLDMATRGADGQLIDAWGEPGIRHGSLSSPAYLDYLFRWCREQIDAGVDYLFMDEHTAALSDREGYDDHSLADFRRYLLQEAPQTRNWAPNDSRWATQLKIDLSDPQICPDGTMRSFDYRAFLRVNDLMQNPVGPQNPLAALWYQFRSWRDDKAWKTLTDRIRAYAQSRGRKVLISANGFAKYVDLQVVGMWARWLTTDGHVDLTENQLPYWRSMVLRGRDVAGKRVPVVLFHDWGFGDPPFPYLAMPPSQRELWIRTRGAEIFSAGAIFAFPVLGPFGCDASKDGTLRTIAKQTAFLQRHRDLYLRGRYIGAENLRSNTPNLSLAVWWKPQPPAGALLLHVVNRNMKEGGLVPQKNVSIELPLNKIPVKVTIISPDWQGEHPGDCRKTVRGIQVTLPHLEAYAIAILHYRQSVDLRRIHDTVRIVPVLHWARLPRNEFRVLPNRLIENAHELNGFIHGMLHTHLRNPPTFIVEALREARLVVKVRAVATAGARLVYRVDGVTKQTIDLSDRDGKNDGDAPEYDKVFAFSIPAGKHRITLDNIGGDWLTLSWLEFQGNFR